MGLAEHPARPASSKYCTNLCNQCITHCGCFPRVRHEPGALSSGSVKAWPGQIGLELRISEVKFRATGPTLGLDSVSEGLLLGEDRGCWLYAGLGTAITRKMYGLPGFVLCGNDACHRLFCGTRQGSGLAFEHNSSFLICITSLVKF